MPSKPSDLAAAKGMKPTEIEDLPPKDQSKEISDDIKGGTTMDPCIRPPRRNVTDRQIEPCWRPGNSSAV